METKNSSKQNKKQVLKNKKWLTEKTDLASKHYGSKEIEPNLVEQKKIEKKEKQELEKLRKQKKQESLKKVDSTSNDVDAGEETKIAFEEYKPKFFENRWFRWLIVGIIAFVVAVIAIVVYFVNKTSDQTPKEISFSSSEQFYWNSTEDIPLRVYLNASYKGDNKKIKLTTSGASGVIKLSKKEVESGELFTVSIETGTHGYANGGTARIIATADETPISAFIDILIDSPTTSVLFVDSEAYKTEIEVCDIAAFEAQAYRGESAVDSNIGVTGRKISYDYFYYNKNNGDYNIVDNKVFEKVAEGTTGSYSKIENENLVTIAEQQLKANSEGKVFVQASVRKWSDYNTEDMSVLTAIRQIDISRCKVSTMTLNSAYSSATEIIKGNTQKFEFNSLIELVVETDDFAIRKEYTDSFPTAGEEEINAYVQKVKRDKVKGCYQFIQLTKSGDGADYISVSQEKDGKTISDGFYVTCKNNLNMARSATITITYVNPVGGGTRTVNLELDLKVS